MTAAARGATRTVRRGGDAHVDDTLDHRATPPRRARGRGPVDWRARERRVALLMVLPQAVPFVLFTMAPLAWVVYLSFTTYDGFDAPSWIGLSNYADLLSDETWWQSVVVSLELAIGKIVVEIPLSLGTALLLNRATRLAALWRTIFFIPNVMSIAVLGIIFYFLLRPDDGVVNSILQSLHLISTPVDWLGIPFTAKASLVLIGVWSGFGINTVLFLVGLQTVPAELVDSAKVDGANGVQRFRYVVLPMLAPMTRVIMILTIVFTLRSFDVVKALTDGGPAGSTDVMFTYLFGYYFSSDRGSQLGYASALSVGASVIIAVVSLLYLAASNRGGSTGSTGSTRRPRR